MKYRVSTQQLKRYVYLVDIRIALRVCKRVENCVEFVEHFDNFHGALGTRICGAIRRKSNDARKHECDTLISLRIYRSLMSKLVSDTLRQHRVEETICHLLLALELTVRLLELVGEDFEVARQFVFRLELLG